tara:strand:+ start:556 stop:1329 length:774 start_codon:yes stop_codon:yes gene_type:complete
MQKYLCKPKQKPIIIIDDEEYLCKSKQKSIIVIDDDEDTIEKQLNVITIDDNIDNNKLQTNCITNKGNGAGGRNTNLYGKKFEEYTCNQTRLINNGYVKQPLTKKTNKLNQSCNYCFIKLFENKTITFVLQHGLKTYIKNKYNIELFRCPDEAYIVEYNTGKKVIGILEKKEQHVEGSVENKLWCGPSFKLEYEVILGDIFEIQYGFCVNDFLQKKIISSKKKYTILYDILQKSNITVLFGENDNYFEMLDNWINNF